MAEYEFAEPENEEPVEEEAVVDPDPEPEPEPEPEEEGEDRFGRLEQAVSELVDWARSVREPQQAPQAAQPAAPRPNFGENTVAAAIWDRMDQMERKIQEPWERMEKVRQENAAVEAAFADLTDKTEQYVQDRAKEGDPRVSTEQVMRVLGAMGVLRDRRTPINTALKLAYNAVAYDQAKASARNQGQQEVRRPDAKIPAPYRPQQGAPRQPVRPQTERVAVTGDRVKDRGARLKAESDRLHAQLSKLSPEELQDSLGGF